jgi:hypothetical protein
VSGHGLIGPSHPEPAAAAEAPAPAATPTGPPVFGDLVTWRDGRVGAVASVDAPWLDPGEVLVWRDRNHTGIADPAWVIPATDLAPSVGGFTYTGGLGR